MSRYTYYYTLGWLLRVYVYYYNTMSYTDAVVLQLRSTESGAGDSIAITLVEEKKRKIQTRNQLKKLLHIILLS